MNEQNFIKNLSQEKIGGYGTPVTAIDQANSCDLLSQDIYTDNKRFIYELLQNADDASCQKGKLDFRIDFIGDYIVVSHQGEPFTEIDIKSICSVGDGNKKEDKNKTGFKGIGFKSVFAYSDFVVIKSKNYCFKFDKQESNIWNPNWGDENDWKASRRADYKDDEIKMPWQIIPVWTEIPNELKQLSVFDQEEYAVSTIIRHNRKEELEKSLTELFSESQIVLFLRSKEIKITINTTGTLTLEKSVFDNTTVLKRNNEIISEWLTKTEQFDISYDVKKKIRNNNRYPRKLRDSERTEISFAIQLEKGKLEAVDDNNRLIFSYLPTSINYKLPFLINANFLTDAGREHIHKDLEWNQWIFNQIPLKYFAWIAELVSNNSKYSKQFLSVLPQKMTIYNELETNFNKGYNEAIESIAFIPNLEGELLKASEALFDETNISGFIGKQTLINYINNTRDRNFSISSFIPHLHPISTLTRLGVEIFKLEDLEGFFISDIFVKEHQLEENFKLISFLYTQANDKQKETGENDWNYRLGNIPFIFDENEKLQKPGHIYFPSVEFSDDFKDDISVIHETVLEDINKNQRIKNWLESLGIKEPTDISFIEKTIIGDDEFITEENAIKIGRYLFNAYKKRLLTEDLFSELQYVKVLTQQGTLKDAQESFLSDFYEPKLKLEGFYNNDFYISKEYFDGEDLRIWGSFFVAIGVKEDIKWEVYSIPANKTWDENLFDYEYFQQKRGFPNSGHSNEIIEYFINKISFFELCIDNYLFSKVFWYYIFNNIKPQIQKDYCRAWYYGKMPLDIKPYFQFIIDGFNVCPTTSEKSLKTSEVFNNSIPQIKEIAGKYLPVLDYDGVISPEWKELLKLKEQLAVEDYLEILTQIWQDIELGEDEQKENKKRVLLIYEKLGELLPGLYSTEKQKLKDWGEDNKLLAKDGNFYPSGDLGYVMIEGFNRGELIYTEKKITDNVIELFKLLGVNIIDKVVPKLSNSIVPQESLRKQLEYIAPLLALVAVEKSKSKKEWEEEYNRIYKKLSEITFYETTEIFLSYGDEQDQQERSTYADGNNFYYVGNWYKPRVLDGLVEPLCNFLNIRYAERILIVLLSDHFSEGLKYLEEKGFDISLIPGYLINSSYEERIPNQTNRSYNSSDEDLGKKGEMIVFEELKRIYSEKYNQSVVEIDNGFVIGNNIEVIWRNKTENTTTNHDFKIIENSKEVYIDSKATPYGKNIEKVPLYISGSELDLMEKAEKYLIARVYNVMSESACVEFVKLEIDNVID